MLKRDDNHPGAFVGDPVFVEFIAPFAPLVVVVLGFFRSESMGSPQREVSLDVVHRISGIGMIVVVPG
jgi:hypothetical protein